MKRPYNRNYGDKIMKYEKYLKTEQKMMKKFWVRKDNTWFEIKAIGMSGNTTTLRTDKKDIKFKSDKGPVGLKFKMNNKAVKWSKVENEYGTA